MVTLHKKDYYFWSQAVPTSIMLKNVFCEIVYAFLIS